MWDIRDVIGSVLLFVNGVWELFRSCSGGLEFEEHLHRLWQRVGAQLYAWSLERLDRRLMQERDRSHWEVVGFRKRTMVSR